MHLVCCMFSRSMVPIEWCWVNLKEMVDGSTVAIDVDLMGGESSQVVDNSSMKQFL